MESTALPAVPSPQPSATGSDRERLVKRAKMLAWLGLGWHGVEATVAIGAGVVASSIALVGFGADSLIEAVAGFVLLWRFAAARASSERASAGRSSSSPSASTSSPPMLASRQSAVSSAVTTPT